MGSNLKKTTFVIPLRIETEDRMRNILTSVIYLLMNTNAKVIIQEEDTISHFGNLVYPQICDVVHEKITNLKHIFIESEDPVFHRTRILNDMTMRAKTQVVVNYDSDVLLELDTYLEAERLIVSGEADVVYPYGMGNWQYQVLADNELVTDFINNDFNFDILRSKSRIWDAKYGFCQFFDRKKYIECGLENENFVSYGYEDDERFYRFSKLANLKRLDAWIYHLEHARTQNSWFSNPHITNNKNLWEKINQMNTEELKEYYSNVDYMRKRNARQK